MTADTIGLLAVIQRYPDHKSTIIRLYKKSEAFQSICEDYTRCVEALRYWKQSSEEEAIIRREEYHELLRDLECDILENL